MRSPVPLLVAILAACRPAVEPAPVAAPVPIDAAVEIDAAVRDGGDPTASLPMVVALHGLGDTPERFIGALDGLSGVRVVALRAPEPWRTGTSWFRGSVRDLPEEALADELVAAADGVVARIEAATARWPTEGAPVVTGFSQGAVLSWAIPLLHPDAVAGAVPVAGFAPASLVPTGEAAARVPPIRALHGAADEVLPLARAEATRDAALAAGVDATLVAFPGVAHAVSAEERAAWHEAVRGLLD
jgi:phospholipase/carboxylesterase